jgi:hypothetical protein
LESGHAGRGGKRRRIRSLRLLSWLVSLWPRNRGLGDLSLNNLMLVARFKTRIQFQDR